MMNAGKFSNVDEYIALYPAPVRKGLEILRKTIKQAAPQAEETISYNMPAYRMNGMLVFFAGAKTHFGFYPTAGPVLVFREELKEYETSKGAIRFPLDKPIPVKLVRAIVKWRVMEDQEAAALKQKAKSLKVKAKGLKLAAKSPKPEAKGLKTGSKKSKATSPGRPKK